MAKDRNRHFSKRMANTHMRKWSSSFTLEQCGQTCNRMKYHFVPSRMALIKNTQSKRLARVWKNWKLLNCENVKWYSSYGKVWQFLKRLNIWPSNPTPRKIKTLCSYKSLYKTDHSSIFHNSRNGNNPNAHQLLNR